MMRLHWRRLRAKHPWLQVLGTWRFWLLALFTVILILYAVSSFRPSFLSKTPERDISQVWVGDMEFDFMTGLYFLKQGKEVYFRGSMPDAHQMDGKPAHCATYNQTNSLCASWFPKVKLTVENIVEEHVTCQSLVWTPGFEHYKPHTCFSVADSKWYGGSLFVDQKWPLNNMEVKFQAYRTRNSEYNQGVANSVGNVLDWFWINSNGVGVIFDSEIPLHISLNQNGDKLLCFYSQSNVNSLLKYRVCKAENMRKMHWYLMNRVVRLPLMLPKSDLFQKPLWSVSPMYKHSVSQENVLKLAKDVMDHGFERSLMSIQDVSLSVMNGKLNPFDERKFPNSHQSMMHLRGDYGFEPFLSVSPFISTRDTQVNKSKFLTNSKNEPIVISYYGNKVHVVNLLVKEVFDWFVKQLNNTQSSFGLSGFVFMGGETDIVEYNCESPSGLCDIDVEKFAKKFSSMADKFSAKTISSSAIRSQSSSGLIQLTSNSSSWNSNGGLRDLIPSVLTLGLLGYPFIVPNTVGGPGNYKISSETGEQNSEIPDRELYVRWMAIAAYMPCLMFSVPPWNYDDEVVQFAKHFAEIHNKQVSPIVIQAAREYETTGVPIIRPMWWTDPKDPATLSIDDQFLVGDQILVAPILDKSASKRDIFIPHGRWLDNLNNKEIEGQTVLKDFEIPLGQIATFTKSKI
ncbi:myogenesis-regulating glycosidase-like isoform X1 [Dreissena polymorpha]|uniref:Family 31 glucosidase KIAA1161 n=1 Tax=Dreissena polymorpha TaxID=45954 RepID=A0A9D4LAS5_DREPO|nr:myogenesis-regulating glycosidase-like isoform X1 [Dreissena polymorpha]XP_052269461.1 myogenesis-regulating glycosidase-like isoform X1 [Dreissena polymorpha]KAH3855155.1 hypothetical protein DPMN_097716 [Dreissena polymorpha]